MNTSILKHFGIQNLPFYTSKAVSERCDNLVDVMLSNGFLALAGTPGTGKTELIRFAKREINDKQFPVKFVHIRDKKDDNVRIGSILNSIVYDLRESDENPKRDPEAKARQVTRLMGLWAVRRKYHICIIIEDAHRMHANTISAIKLLREEDFAGHAPLFSVILLGWPRMMAKIDNRKDIKWRITDMQLDEDHGWMDVKERISYIETKFPGIFANETLNKLALQCKVPAEIDHTAMEAMSKAFHMGASQVDNSIYAPTLKDEAQALGLTLSDLENLSGVRRSSVSDVLNNSSKSDENKRKVEAAIEAIRIKKMRRA